MAITPIRVLRYGLWAAVAAALLAVLWFRVLAPQATDSFTDTLGQGDYVLQGTDGQPFTQATLKGEPTAIFFGFTHCPDVCPTTLGEVLTWQEELAKDNKALRVFFITVDPERDGAGMLGDYVSWVPGVTGVTGSRAETDKAIKAFRIFAKKVPGNNGDYVYDHTAYVMLFDASGRFDQIVSYQEPLDRVMPRLRRLVGL